MDTGTIITIWLTANITIVTLATMRATSDHLATTRLRAATMRARARLTHDTPTRTAARNAEPFPLEHLTDRWDAEDRGGRALHDLLLENTVTHAWRNTEGPDGLTPRERDFLMGTGKGTPEGILAFRCDELPPYPPVVTDPTRPGLALVGSSS